MLTKRQYNILSFYLTRSLFLGGGLSLLVGLSKNDLLVTGIVGMLLGYVLLFCFYKKGGISNILSILIACLVLFINMLANTVLTSTYLLYSTPTFFIVGIFIILVLYLSRFKETIIGRVSEVFIIGSFIAITFAILGLIYEIEVDNILPLFNTKYISIIKGVIVFTGASLLPNLLLLNNTGNLKFRDIQWGYIVGSILMIMVLFLVVTIYGSEFASIARFPEFMILKKIDVMGYFDNVENILVMEWMFNILISAFVCINTINKRCPKICIYGILVFLFIISEFVFSKSYVSILYVKNYFYYVSFILVMLSLVIKKSKN